MSRSRALGGGSPASEEVWWPPGEIVLGEGRENNVRGVAVRIPGPGGTRVGEVCGGAGGHVCAER
ncbi:hypothetical protein ABZ820_09680 [Streptomyces diacarni]|uniref:hypothetical protein n=1 Tax=Streptomyces diacarni TaxID=2800381 RepID=UPI0033CC7886